MKVKPFTSENCIYWIKTKNFNNWKLAIYNEKLNEFRLVNNKMPSKETFVFKKEECSSYMVAMEIETEKFRTKTKVVCKEENKYNTNDYEFERGLSGMDF